MLLHGCLDLSRDVLQECSRVNALLAKLGDLLESEHPAAERFVELSMRKRYSRLQAIEASDRRGASLRGSGRRHRRSVADPLRYHHAGPLDASLSGFSALLALSFCE